VAGLSDSGYGGLRCCYRHAAVLALWASEVPTRLQLVHQPVLRVGPPYQCGIRHVMHGTACHWCMLAHGHSRTMQADPLVGFTTSAQHRLKRFASATRGACFGFRAVIAFATARSHVVDGCPALTTQRKSILRKSHTPNVRLGCEFGRSRPITPHSRYICCCKHVV
jgi:hypothetical protein